MPLKSDISKYRTTATSNYIPDALYERGLSRALISNHGDLGQRIDKTFNSKIPQTLNALDELLYPTSDDM